MSTPLPRAPRHVHHRAGAGPRLAWGLAAALLLSAAPARADEDPREPVPLPEMMQRHMLSNMRDHLAALDDILRQMAAGELDQAAQVAEARLGMSSLDDHGAAHMAPLMPARMRALGTDMHRAASRFALRAQEGEPAPAYQALSEVTAACVACHAAYRLR
jgi:cytochrome c556